MEDSVFLLLLVCFVIDKSNQDPINYSPGFGICNGLKQGTQIAHPESCSKYFVCNNGFPDVVKCEDELHYDRRYKVCNWPENANCKLGEYPPNWNNIDNSTTVSSTITIKPSSTKKTTLKSTSTTVKPSKITTTTTPKLETTTIVNCIPSNPSIPSNSTTGATDDRGNLIDPLEKYNPLNVQCFHNGLYFLPHPVQCNKYFICSNHVLYLHECGYGTWWNYEDEHCDLRQNSICYYSDQIINKSTTRKRKTTTRNIQPPTAAPVTTQSTTEIDSTTKKQTMPPCPSKGQIFLPHPTDCTKYYICIAGIPALTTCPNGMYWDEREQWCGYPEFTYCQAAISKPPVKN